MEKKFLIILVEGKTFPVFLADAIINIGIPVSLADTIEKTGIKNGIFLSNRKISATDKGWEIQMEDNHSILNKALLKALLEEISKLPNPPKKMEICKKEKYTMRLIY